MLKFAIGIIIGVCGANLGLHAESTGAAWWWGAWTMFVLIAYNAIPWGREA